MKQKKIIKICWTVESQVCKFLGCEFALHLLRHRYRTFSKIIVQVSEAFTMCLHVYSGLFVHLSVNLVSIFLPSSVNSMNQTESSHGRLDICLFSLSDVFISIRQHDRSCKTKVKVQVCSLCVISIPMF